MKMKKYNRWASIGMSVCMAATLAVGTPAMTAVTNVAQTAVAYAEEATPAKNIEDAEKAIGKAEEADSALGKIKAVEDAIGKPETADSILGKIKAAEDAIGKAETSDSALGQIDAAIKDLDSVIKAFEGASKTTTTVENAKKLLTNPDDKDGALEEINAAKAKIDEAKAKVADLEAKITAAKGAIDDAKTAIDKAKEVADKTDELKDEATAGAKKAKDKAEEAKTKATEAATAAEAVKEAADAIKTGAETVKEKATAQATAAKKVVTTLDDDPSTNEGATNTAAEDISKDDIVGTEGTQKIVGDQGAGKILGDDGVKAVEGKLGEAEQAAKDAKAGAEDVAIDPAKLAAAKQALADKIKDAKKALEGVEEKEDGTEPGTVDEGTKFAEKSDIDTLKQAIQKAEEALNATEPAKTISELKAATNTLDGAINTFKPSKIKDGAKPLPEEVKDAKKEEDKAKQEAKDAEEKASKEDATDKQKVDAEKLGAKADVAETKTEVAKADAKAKESGDTNKQAVVEEAKKELGKIEQALGKMDNKSPEQAKKDKEKIKAATAKLDKLLKANNPAEAKAIANDIDNILNQVGKKPSGSGSGSSSSSSSGGGGGSSSGGKAITVKNNDGKDSTSKSENKNEVAVTGKEEAKPSENKPSFENEKSGYVDVAPNAWYNSAVNYVVEKGILVGTSADKFSPDANTTRAMMAAVVHRIAGEPAATGKSPFTDVTAGQWYTSPITWAAENNIVSGIGHEMFAPDAPLTREQLVTIVYNYVKSVKDVPAAKETLDEFTDKGQISPYAVDAMKWAVENGIVSGMGDNHVAPKALATRAQLAKIVMNINSYLGK